jgi:mannose-1-phosphate guanylyltransferase
MSYDRVAPLCGPERVLVLTADRFVPLVRQQLPELPVENILGEPLRRDTAAPVAMSALLAEKRFGDPVITILTSDQLIEPDEAFQSALLSAARGAKSSDALYTFGIEPNRPATEYGYLELGDEILDDDGTRHHALERIVEKPDADTAAEYLATGRFVWNSGMFVWRASSILGEVERQLPAHIEHLRPAALADGTPGFADAMKKGFEPLQKISVDYGIMEGAQNVRCVRGRFEWSDVGGFAALKDHLPRDDAGNVHRGRVLAKDARDNLVFCDDADELVALVGVRGLVVVRAGGRTLVMPEDRLDEIKQLVAELPDEER